MKKKYQLIILVFAFSLSTTIILGQNNYKFIEPNISFFYDSTKIQIGTRYSNTFYETESYDFKSLTDTINKITINVKADHPVPDPMSKLTLEKKMTARIPEILKLNSDRISIIEYDKNVRQIGDFLCFGFIILDKKTQHSQTAITCNHISEADITEIRLLSKNRNSLLADYKILETFLNGFQFYTKEKILIEDSLIKAKYTISVLPTEETIENLKWRTNSFFAIVKTNEPLSHKVKEVRIDNGYGQEIFPPEKNGNVYITCSDKEKGAIVKKGELVILNSFGKIVKIPFTFKYDKK